MVHGLSCSVVCGILQIRDRTHVLHSGAKIFVQKGLDHFVSSVNDGKRKIRFKKGSLEISSNIDKRY